jgi:hypothetical protein
MIPQQMKQEGSMTILVLLIITLGVGLTYLLIETGMRYVRISIAEEAAATAAKAAAATYGKGLTEKLRACVISETAQTPSCGKIPSITDCITKQLISCEPETALCIKDAKTACGKNWDRIKATVTDEAHSVAAQTVEKYFATMTNFSIDETGRVKVWSEIKSSPLISRWATARDTSFAQ